MAEEALKANWLWFHPLGQHRKNNCRKRALAPFNWASGPPGAAIFCGFIRGDSTEKPVAASDVIDGFEAICAYEHGEM